MNKIFAAALLSLGLVVPSAASDLSTVFDATVRLYHEDTRVCSAEFIKSDEEQDLLITAAHCVNKPNDLTIRLPNTDEELNPTNTEVYNVDVLRKIVARDVAILELRDPTIRDFPVVDVATEEESASLRVGTPSIVVGYPRNTPAEGEELTVTDGRFLGPGKVPSGVSGITGVLFKLTNPVTFGSSGSGAYVEFADGWKLIGLASLTNSNPAVDFMTWTSTTESVRLVMDRVGLE